MYFKIICAYDNRILVEFLAWEIAGVYVLNKKILGVGIKVAIACLASASFFNLSLEPAKAGCNEFDITCNPHIKPILKPAVEQLWGEAGSAGYQAAAITMRERNGDGQDFDETQKRFLRQRYRGLVDQVRVSYGARMMDQLCANGLCTSTDSAAQTYCDRIYVNDSYKPDDAKQLLLLVHEMRHSEQCRELGGAGKFGFHYFREFKRSDQTYATNSMEVDARNSAKDFANNVICPQVGCPPTSGQYWQNYDNLGIDLPVSLKLTPNPRATGDYYTKRIGEHCQWFLNNKGRVDWWNLIQVSAQRDAGNTNSDYYRTRIADHCEWYVNHEGRTDWWNLIEGSARKDAKL